MINKYTYLVELVLAGVAGAGNQANRFDFLDQPYLRFKSLTGLETYTSSDISKSPMGNTVISPTQMKTAFLNLYTTDPDNAANDGEFIQKLPLVDLHTLVNGTDVYARPEFKLAGQTIFWEKSYVTFGTPLANTTNLSLLINVSFSNASVRTFNN